MRSAAACIVFFVLALGVFSAGAAAAGPLDPVTSLTGDVQAQTGSLVNDPVGTATGTVSEVTGAVSGTVDTVSGAADEATGGATAPVSGAVNGTVGAVTGSANNSVDAVVGSVSGTGASSGSGGGLLGSGSTSSTSTSGSASDGGSTARTRHTTSRRSNRGSPRTAFDRLPRRYEALLERIEAGQHVRAGIARLRALLASASPQLRARILRLIGVEIRRLERGGVTPRERAMLERLRRLRSALAPKLFPPVGQTSLPLAAPAPSAAAAGTGSVGDFGRNAAFGGSERPAKSEDSGGGSGLIALPSVPGPPYLLVVLLGALACGLLIAAAAGRRVLPAHVRWALATHGGAQLSAVAATLGLILAVAVAFMIQAFLA